MIAILITIALAATAFSALAAEKGTAGAWIASGNARVIDGDTIELKQAMLALCPMPEGCPDPEDAYESVAPITVRLNGIDAPEQGQICYRGDGAPWMCGIAATTQLEALIGLDRVVCIGGGSDIDEVDRYGRRIGDCLVEARGSLNADMVRLGFALAYQEYSDQYVHSERVAKLNKAGMWSGDFVPPWEWRRKKKERDFRDRIDRELKQMERNKI